VYWLQCEFKYSRTSTRGCIIIAPSQTNKQTQRRLTAKLMNLDSARLPLRLTPLLLCLSLPLPLVAQDNNQLDWSPIESVPKALRDERCQNCEGRYMDPLADADMSTPAEENDIEASAATTEIDGSTVTLSGKVSIEQGYRKLQGDNATVDRKSESGTLTGNIMMREPGVLLRGDRAEFSAENSEATVSDAQFVLHEQHMRGSASQLHRDEEGLIHIKEGSLSYCAPENDDWALGADSIELDLKEGVGTARGAKVRVKGVPIFYLPWMNFPLDDRRKTGFLWPEIGSESKGGFDITAPVYLNLAPNYDAFYAPRYIEERGLNNELKLRYLGDYTGYWSVGGAYLDNDKRYKDEFPDERSHDRWIGMVNHNGLLRQRWRSTVDYSKASDVNYIKDLDSSSLDAKRQTALLQRGAMDYLGDDWLLAMEVQQFQSLADDINNDYKKLPQITGQYRGNRESFKINPIALAQYSNFDSDRDVVTGERIYAEVGVQYPMQWLQGFITPTVKYRALDYNLESGVFPREDENPSSGSALASLNSGLYFERQTHIAGKGLLQTLEPRLFYLYSEFDEQFLQPDFDSAELTFSYNQLFRETRFSGHDRLDDANHLSVGLTTRFIGDDDGHQYMSASIGQIFYFDDRKVRLSPLDPVLDKSGSELAAELTFNPNSRLNVRGNIVWDPYSGDVNSGSIQTNYIADNNAIFNVGYTFRRPQGLFENVQPITEQATMSTYLPLWSNWSAFASWSYSLEAETTIEDMFGVEYDSCCWKVRLLHLRYFDNVTGETPDFSNPNLEREQSTQVQFILKGMGGFGSRVTSILEDMIRGFEEREI
jgi:LPS-assembly protein